MSRNNPSFNEHTGDELSDEIRWTLIATAPDQLTAEMWQQLMWQETIPAMLDPHDTISFMGLASTPVRLMVPTELAVKAREVLAGVDGTADWVDLGESDETGGPQDD